MMHDNLPPLVLLAGLVDGVHWILVIFLVIFFYLFWAWRQASYLISVEAVLTSTISKYFVPFVLTHSSKTQRGQPLPYPQTLKKRGR